MYYPYHRSYYHRKYCCDYGPRYWDYWRPYNSYNFYAYNPYFPFYPLYPY